MSLRADHFDTVPCAERPARQHRKLAVSYFDRSPSGTRQCDASLPANNFDDFLQEEDVHALVRLALVEQKSLVIQMADRLSTVTFSGCGSNLLVNHDLAGHGGVYSLCTASWIIWEIYRGCPSRMLSDLLAFIPPETCRAGTIG